MCASTFDNRSEVTQGCLHYEKIWYVFQVNPASFVQRFLTYDERWVPELAPKDKEKIHAEETSLPVSK